VPTPSCNGFESAIARAFRSATEEQICLVATVRLVTPQFLKVRALRLHLPFRAGIGRGSAAELLLDPRAGCSAVARGATSQQPRKEYVQQRRLLVQGVGRGERTLLCLGVGDNISMYFGMMRYNMGAAFEKRWSCDGVSFEKRWSCEGVSQSSQPRKHQYKVTSKTTWKAAAFKEIHPTAPLCKKATCFLKHREHRVSWALSAGL